jgi:pyruvate,orthophosphate dikinase
LRLLRSGTVAVADEVIRRRGSTVEYLVGHDDRGPSRRPWRPTRIAEEAEFFSFGTNDLTQMTFGFCGRHQGVHADLPEGKILPIDPFQSIDFTASAELIEMAPKGACRRKEKHGST